MSRQRDQRPRISRGRRSAHWAQLEETGVYWGMRVLLGVHARGGRGLFRILLYPVVLYYFLVAGSARRASLDYLRRLKAHYPQVKPQPTLWWSYRHFIAFAETMLDKLTAWRGGVADARIDFPNRPLLLEQLGSGRGAVLLTAHLGNLEMCRALADRRAPVRLTVLVHTRHAANFNRLLARYEHSAKVELMQVTELTPATAVELEQRIEAGELLVITADRVPVHSKRTVRARFLGAPAAFPQGPFILAGLLRAPVFTLFCTRRGADYHIDLDLLCEEMVLPRRDRVRELEKWAQRFSERLQCSVRETPLQWFNFYDFWMTK